MGRPESGNVIDFKVILSSGNFLASSAILTIPIIGFLREYAVPVCAASAIFTIAGRVADTISTERIIQTTGQAQEIGFRHNLIERCPHLPEVPTVKDLYGKRILLVESCGIAASTAVPILGAVLGLASFLAARSNEKLNRQLKLDIKIFKRLRELDKN